jgi:guanine deaminase
VARLSGFSVNPEQLLYLATLGSAKALRIDRHVGSIETGKEADFAVLNLESTALISRRQRGADSIWEKLFLHMILGDDRSICATIVDGRIVHEHGHAARRIKAAGGPAPQ